jgi:hypothetical protein
VSAKARQRNRIGIGRTVSFGLARARAATGAFRRFPFPQGIATRRLFTPEGVVRPTIRRPRILL